MTLRERLGVARGRARGESPATFDAGLAVTRIRVKNNLLLFYAETQTVVKLFSDVGAKDAHLRGIESGRQAFAFLRVPSVIDSGDSPIPFVTHPILNGEKPTDQLIRRRLPEVVADIASLHRGTIRWTPIEKRTPLDVALREAEGEGLTVSSELREMVRHSLPSSALQADCHGDLSRGNMIGSQQPYVLDWEIFGSSPVVRDLVKLSTDQERLFSAYADASQKLELEITRSALHSQAGLYLLDHLASVGKKYYDNWGKPERYLADKQSALRRAEHHLRLAATSH